MTVLELKSYLSEINDSIEGEWDGWEETGCSTPYNKEIYTKNVPDSDKNCCSVCFEDENNKYKLNSKSKKTLRNLGIKEGSKLYIKNVANSKTLFLHFLIPALFILIFFAYLNIKYYNYSNKIEK